MLFLFDTMFTMMGLILNNLPAEMAITAGERSKIVVFSFALGIPAWSSPLYLPALLLGGDNPDIDLFRTVMAGIAIFGAAVMISGSYMIKENKYTVLEEPLGFVESIKVTFKNRPFLIMVVFIFAFAVYLETGVSGLIYMIDYVLVIDGPLGIISTILCVVFAIGGVAYLVKKVDSIGIRKVTIYASIISLIGMMILQFIGIFSDYIMRMEIAAFGMAFMICGLFTMLMTNQALQGECVDYDEIQTGKRRETTYSGISALLTKPAVSIAHFITLSTMSKFGFDQDLPVSLQLPSVSEGVLHAFTLGPAFFIIFGIIAMIKFPLDGEMWHEQKQELYEIHLRKEREFLASLASESSSSSVVDEAS
jgi:GPH family glycoside/pentoside/hexuronide:cation symporter